MSDLIWIGNALYPRWVLFAVLVAAGLALAAFSAFMSEKVK